MNYNTDRAITKVEDDLLGRSSFSEALGKALYEYDAKDGLVIGLYGKWGTGKTSIANMALQTVTKYAKPESAPIIVRFSPWNYSDKDNLISQFFTTLNNVIKGSGNLELDTKIGKTLKDYAGLFDAFSLVPIYGTALAAALKATSQLGGEMLEQRGDLNTCKKNLEKALGESDQKFIVIIDDIDRLTKFQICDIFQLVKQVADFPNMMYVLLMDREIVKNALAEVHNCDGNDYLDKIVQVPFEIPEIDKARLNGIFQTKLIELFESLPREHLIDNGYWTAVFRNCVSPYALTLRDVNRVLNTFDFKFSLMYSETSFEDMVGITTIEVLEPELYRWIIDHKSDLCKGTVDPWISMNVKNNEYRKYYSEELEKLGIDSQKAIKCLATLFPLFSAKVGITIGGSRASSNIRSKMRIADEDRFDLYFVRNLKNVKVSRVAINECIYSLSKKELLSEFSSINEKGNAVYLLQEIEALIDSIPYDRLSIIASALYSIKPALIDARKKASLSLSADVIADELARSMVKRIKTNDERYDFLRERISNSSVVELYSIAEDIHRIESAWGHIASVSMNRDEQIVSEDQLKMLKESFVERLKTVNKLEEFIELDDFYDLYYYWNQWDKDSANECLNRLFEDDVYKLRFICKLAGTWEGTHGKGWSFIRCDYQEFISKEELTNLMLQVIAERLNEFSETEKMKIATFLLEVSGDHVTEQEARNVVERWTKAKS